MLTEDLVDLGGKNLLCSGQQTISAAAPVSGRFTFHKIPMPLLAAATRCMHGLGFADVRKTGCSLQTVTASLQPVVTAIMGIGIVRNAKQCISNM